MLERWPRAANDLCIPALGSLTYCILKKKKKENTKFKEKKKLNTKQVGYLVPIDRIMSSNAEKDAMDVDVNDAEIEDEIDEFNDNEEAQISQPAVKDGSNPISSSSQPLVPELPELNRKDKKLKEILDMMDDYSPIIPDAVTDYLMAKNGLQINDLNIKRLLALATQKFISDIAQDAYEYSRIRSNTVNKLKNTLNNNAINPAPLPQPQQGLTGGTGTGTGTGTNTGASAGNSGGANPNNEKLTLTVEDLSSALEEHGVNVKRPNFYR